MKLQVKAQGNWHYIMGQAPVKKQPGVEEEPRTHGPPTCEFRKQRKPKKEQKKRAKRGSEVRLHQIRWNKHQDFIYARFMREHQKLFFTENLRRTGRVFMKLSKEMNGVRTPNQCKSHHQKMQRVTKNGTVGEIIQYLSAKHNFPRDFELQKPQNQRTTTEATGADNQKEKFRQFQEQNGKHLLIRVLINWKDIPVW